MEKEKYVALILWIKYHFAEDGNGFLSLDTQEYYTVEALVHKYVTQHNQN
jgi:hypothetical protein